MSFSSFISRMFGGDDTEVAEEFDELDGEHTETGTPAPQAPAAPVAELDGPAAELADGILSIINSQLPPAVSRFIDSGAQRRWLAAELGPCLKAYGDALRMAALAELTGDKAKIQAELEELRSERKEVTSKREEQKAALLSEQRQRRALAERNRDLEAKIAELDSEIEQHRLTISSLMNKLRVAEVAEQDAEAAGRLNEELAELRARIADRDSKLAIADRLIAEADERLSALSAREAEQTEAIAAKDAEIASLAEKLAEAESASALQQALAERREIAGEADPEAAQPAEPARKRRGRPRKQQAPAAAQAPDPEQDSSADLEEVDWLLPGGVPAGHVGHVSDPEFGYQPPKQSPAPINDAQLTLF